MSRPVSAIVLALLSLVGCGPTEPIEPLVGPITYWAEKGDALAQYNLGLMYETGQGVTANADQARHWYRAATESVPDSEPVSSDSSLFNVDAARAAGAVERDRVAKSNLLSMYASLKDGLQNADQAANAARQRLANLP